MLTFSRQYSFSAAHRLWQHGWSATQNNEAFGVCTRVHGHNYTVTVVLSGVLNSTYGGIYDMTVLDRVINEQIIAKVDSCRLDTDVDFLAEQIITVEALAQTFFNRIAPSITDDRFPETRLHSVRVNESADLWAEATHATE